MDKFLTKNQIQQIINNAPKSAPKEQIISGLISRGYQLEGLDSTKPKEEKLPTNTFGQKVGNIATEIASFTGGEEIAQSLGQGLALGQNEKLTEQVQKQQFDTQSGLIDAIKKGKQSGQDTTKLELALSDITNQITKTGATAEQLYNPNQLTDKQIIGDALQLGTTLASIGSLTGTTGIVKTITSPTTIGQGIIQGAKTGALSGTAFGGVSGVSQGLQEDKDAVDILKQAGTSALTGGVTGGIIGGLVGGISGGIQGRKLNQQIIKAQEESGLRPSLSEVIKQKSVSDPKFASIIKEAQKQGYNEKEINLLASLSDADKPIAQKMYQATIKAQSDPRQIVRAADILGENATGIVKQVQRQNSLAGKLVDTIAKALKGKSFDATPIRDSILSQLDDAGITIIDGNVDFSQSIFKNTPKLQKEIERVIKTIPDGSDAYQAHIFKKSVDELVDYGTGGEGLSGKASSILKGFRNAVDDVLDTNFDDYNLANTEFKVTREFIDEVKNTVGKKVDFSTKEGSQAFGQAFRSAFSNNKSRGQTLKLIEDLQLIAKQRGLKGAEQNLLDQALYVNILEDTFGSQAATGLASEVSKGVKTAKGVIEGIRNPVSGILNATADALEAAQNIKPEAKKQILESFIK